MSLAVLYFVITVFAPASAKGDNSLNFQTSRLNVVNHLETIFSWSRDACEKWDIPDAPARAYRDADGNIRFIASSSPPRAFVGQDLDHIHHQCGLIFRGAESRRPDAFDWHAWLTSFYTEDGHTVYALVHNEFHGHERRELCPFQVYLRCWRNAITFAVSTNSGRTFAQPLPPQNVVASLPYKYDGNFGKHTGYFGPTNIIKYGGFYYVLFYATEYRAQTSGFCIMRTDHLDDPSSWRAWDGKNFSVVFINPYKTNVRDPGKHVCQPVGRSKLLGTPGAVVRHEPSGTFILVMAGWKSLPSGTTEGIFASTSRDLINWTSAELIWEAPVSWERSCPSESYGYPSLIDPNSSTRNFETVGNAAYLYVTRFNLKGCKPTADRDLIRLLIHIGVNQ